MISVSNTALLYSDHFPWQPCLEGPWSARYTSVLKELYRVNLSNPVKMGLQKTQRLNELLGDPFGKVCIIHVAGTKGRVVYV
jgi:hypothetical protein